jgi:hypothetical protein
MGTQGTAEYVKYGKTRRTRKRLREAYEMTSKEQKDWVAGLGGGGKRRRYN